MATCRNQMSLYVVNNGETGQILRTIEKSDVVYTWNLNDASVANIEQSSYLLDVNPESGLYRIQGVPESPGPKSPDPE